jgi:aspartyl protease family protein
LAPPDRVAARPATSPESPSRAAPSPQPREPVSNGRRVALRSDDYGQFQANAVINGHAVTVVVDTGATTVAISTDTARQLGVAPPQSAYKLPISTANGVGYAAPVVLREVSVGSISIRNVNAVVIPGRGLGISLLGMTFLSRLSKFEVAKGQLVLTE